MTEALMPLMAEVRNAAKRIAARWPDVLTADDLEQEIALRLIEDKYLDAITAMDGAARTFVLGKIGDHIAAAWRDDYEVYSGNYYYGTTDVRKLLDSGTLRGRREQFDVERLDLMTALAEVNAENPEGVLLIIAVYERNEPAGDPARRKKLQRAVDVLTKHMNRARSERASTHENGPGSRQVLTNSQAQAITGRSY